MRSYRTGAILACLTFALSGSVRASGSFGLDGTGGFRPWVCASLVPRTL